MDVIEEWRPARGFDGRYEVSSLGRVASRVTIGRPPLGAAPEHAERKIRATPPRRRDGYFVVSLAAEDGTAFLRSVHRLVCEAFHGQRPPGCVVRHLDGDKENNRSSNLAWGTAAENNADRVRHGRHPNANKTHCKLGHPLSDGNLYINATSGARQCRICQRKSKMAYASKRASS